jgi:hypothetical protein
MIFDEIIEESKLNAWNRLVLLLNKIFGFNSNGKAKVRRIKQGFDQKKGEHVILLEYRVKAVNQSPIKTNKSKVKIPPNTDKNK